MQSLAVEFGMSGGSVRPGLDGLESRLSGLSGPLEAFGRVMMGSVARNFAEQGRPQRWKPLAESTVRRKGSDRILVDTGALMGSAGFRAGTDRLTIYARAPYASIHQLGGHAGVGGSAVIPARPFLVFQEAGVSRLKGLILEHLLQRRTW